MTVLTRDQVRVSRRISMVLRHRPESAGLTLDTNGWVPVTDLGVWLAAVVPPQYLSLKRTNP